MPNAIELRNLTKKYKGFRLDNVNLALPEGAIMGFIGENGAGKSTTIKLLLDMIHRDSGEALVFGTDISKHPRSVMEHIGVVLDESNFPDGLTIADVEAIEKNIYKTWNSTHFLRYTKRFRLPDKKKIKEFSRGMRMKLSIAVALSHDCRLLVLDEATSGLDPIVRDEILDIFLEFIQTENHSILISSHIISDLEKICDYITFIHEGKILFSEVRDDLPEKYALLRCTKDQFAALPAGTVVGCRRNEFGVDALVKREGLKTSAVSERPTLEDIMLYFVKGDH